MAHVRGLGRAGLIVGAAVAFVFALLWFGDVAHACSGPDDPMCSGMETTPPNTGGHTGGTGSQSVTQSNQSSTYSNTPPPQQSDSSSGTEAPSRVVTRSPSTSPSHESLPQQRQPTYEPVVPAEPTVDTTPPVTDPQPLPAVQLGQVPIPQAPPSPPSPPPSSPSSDGPGSVPLGVAGLVGLGAGTALAASKKGGELDMSTPALGVAEVGASLAVGTATAIGIETGVLAIGAGAVLGPIGVALFTGLAIKGVIDIFSVPKAEPTGGAAHAGSVRG